MSSGLPIVRQYSWNTIPQQLVPIVIFSIIAYFLDLNSYFGIHGLFANITYGAIGQIILWQIIRNTITRDHKQAERLLKQEKYAEAIPFFENSYDKFSKHPWFEKYRHFLGCSSRISYREMALNNIAFCYSQTGEKANSIEYYNRTLAEFPDSGIAKAALRMINTMTDAG